MIYTATVSDSTAATVETAILYMVLYPAATKKAQAELDTAFGKDRFPVPGDWLDLPYVTASLMVRCFDIVDCHDSSIWASGSDAMSSCWAVR